MKKNKILFSGYYGHQNLGDDVFCLISRWGAKKYWNEENVSYLSKTGPTNKDFGMDYVLPNKSSNRIMDYFWQYKSIISTKINILAGGSILHSKYNIISPQHLIFFLARLKLRKVGAIGVSIGPFKSEKDYQYIKKQLNFFSFLIIRDKSSYDIAISMNLPYKPVLSSDLAYLLSNVYYKEPIETTNDKKVLGISLCPCKNTISKNLKNEEDRYEKIFKTLKLLCNSNIYFKFFIINGNENGDFEITNNMINKLQLEDSNFEIINYNEDIMQTIHILSSCDAVLSVRLHGAILSSVVNVPSLLVKYHTKCTDYLNDMDIDLKWRIGDINDEPEELKIKIEKLFLTSSKDFYKNKSKLLKLAELNFSQVNLQELIN